MGKREVVEKFMPSKKRDAEVHDRVGRTAPGAAGSPPPPPPSEGTATATGTASAGGALCAGCLKRRGFAQTSPPQDTARANSMILIAAWRGQYLQIGPIFAHVGRHVPR